MSYGRLLGIPPHTSQFIYNNGIWWEISFETELYTPYYYYFWDRCGTHAVELSQIQLVQQQQKHWLIKLWKILY